MSIIHPLILLALMTLAFAVIVFFTRIGAVRRGEMAMTYFALFNAGQPTEAVIKTQRHYANLFEAPVLFYVAALLILQQGFDGPIAALIGYAYVAARFCHLIIHTTSNRLGHRINAFIASMLILFVLWGYVVWSLL